MIFLGIGSSIGEAETIFVSAEKFLEKNGVFVLKKSTIYKNPPFGGIAKNEFSNAVWGVKMKSNKLLNSQAMIEEAKKLLSLCKKCEIFHGRDLEKEKWSDRTLDIDILMFDSLILRQENLKIPHQEIPNRCFVLQPWSEIVSLSFVIPIHGNLQNLLKKVSHI